MRRFLAIVLMLLFAAQFVPVAQDYTRTTYSITLEEEQTHCVGKEEGKMTGEALTSFFTFTAPFEYTQPARSSQVNDRLSKPYCSRPTPPPDSTC